ncbi:MAG: tetratricopeptide repeat protein [Proteobacteria bacterium]|nr:tetratricopeptide repeat protein [Pseudomonadota bacterium]
MSSFLSELRRRNVLRVAAAYGLVAWIIIEAGSVLLPVFGAADEGTFQVYVMIVLAGFLVALVSAWVFEITPDGVKLDKDVDRTIAAGKPQQRFNYAIIGLLIVALAVSITFNVTGVRGGLQSAQEGPANMRRSIAVLPFASLATDPESASFVDGIHDDLLTKLANIGSLRVISRTSVLEYRNTSKNLRQIGRELGVDTVLEGTVQRAGDNVRINVQLIDAQTDEHLWAQTYDRQLTMQNIFSIQTEISEAISGALRVTLMPRAQERIKSIPTEDIRAYSLYVSGRDNLYLRRLETLRQAQRQFEQAIELDPDYADAYVALAECTLLLSINHNALTRDEAYDLAQANLDEAFRLNPDLADAYATQGLLKSDLWSQTRTGPENIEAEAAFEYAISLNPNHARAYMWFARLRDAEQRYEDSIALYHRSMQLDPLGRIPYSNLPTLYAQQGQNEVALKLWLDAIEIHPEWPTPYQYIAAHLLGLGRLDEAYAWSLAAQELSTDPALAGNIGAIILLQFGEIDKARALLSAFPDGHPLAGLTDGFQLLIDENYAGALEVFTQVIDEGDAAAPFILDIASDIALLAGDLDKAREYVLRRTPILDKDTDLQIDRFTVGQIVKLAYIQQREGDLTAGNEMLNATLPVVQSLPRLGMFGQGIRDVQILALLGKKEDALQALRAAVTAGYRCSISSNSWLLENDPFLDSIRDDSRFAAILSELESLNGVMRSRVMEAEETGNWAPLKSLVGST